MDVLYSLIGIGIERIDRLVKDEMFTNTLNFVLINDDDDNICSITESMLNRYHLDILPKVQYNVKCFIFESMLMERILLVANYPNLTQLKIYNFNRDFVSHYFIDESPFADILKQQITDLTLISNQKHSESLIDYTTNVCVRILNFFKNLKHFSIKQYNEFCPNLSFESLPSTIFSSSILTKLCITVDNFDDCLCLLDGHLKQLSTFNISIYNVENHPSIVHNSNDLPNMKCFSLKIRHLRDVYDSEIVPLIRRMCNLEKLTLYLCIQDRNKYVDGIQLQNDILIYLEQLRTFVFYISSEINSKHHVSTLSSDDIKRTFNDVKYGQVASFIDHCITGLNICHVFSIPFAFDSLDYIRNNLPNIIFNNVTSLSIMGSIRFKHEYFLRLAQTFPLLKSLYFSNIIPETLDSDESKSNYNELYSIVEYPHLRSLNILDVYIDYAEQFLDESKTRLPNLIELKIDYDTLETLTENFRRDTTRLNCINIKRLIHYETFGINEIIVKPKDYYLYFPLL